MEDITPLLDLIAKQNEQIIELSKALIEAKQPQIVETPVPMRQYPLWVPEDEEDARAAHAAGEINDGQLQEALRELEFFNEKITVPTPGI